MNSGQLSKFHWVLLQLFFGAVLLCSVSFGEIIEVSLPSESASDVPVVVGVPGMKINNISFLASGNAQSSHWACEEFDPMFGWQLRYEYWMCMYIQVSISSGECRAEFEKFLCTGEFAFEVVEPYMNPECFDELENNAFNFTVHLGGDPSDPGCVDPGADNYGTRLIEPGELTFIGDLLFRFDMTNPVVTEGCRWGKIKAFYR